ncbi:MAG: GLUG motif-containing protein [Patescibacteria group bacterium]|nr:GLUG motif-containing protein [Patescibacteria group bacterium]MDD4304314.1 GLUG motif-containing protein [Patescibacteria group bacterium]MDD4695577.1 GLUG motif-containing protein [Patescibacteria group bacterium]
MKKINKYIILSFFVFLFFIINTNTTKAATSTIDSIQDLYNIRNNLSGNYELGANLDFDDINSYDVTTSTTGYDTVAEFKTAMTSGTGWLPIGDYDNKFMGNLDGNSYTISNLFINRPTTDSIGLFGYTNGASITNIFLENVEITGRNGVGGLIGVAYMISSLYVENCGVQGNVNSTHMSVGGLIGVAQLLGIKQILNSYAIVDVTGSATQNIGGLVGENSATISNSYSSGNVSGTGTYIGGLVGYNTDFGNIINSYATGRISKKDGGSGGLIGRNQGTVINSYYNSETTGQIDTRKGDSKTTLQMTSSSTFIGWDFDTIWNIEEGSSYPYLRHQNDILLYNYPIIVTLEKDISVSDSDYILTLSWNPVITPSDYTFLGYDIYRNDIKIVDYTFETEYIDNILEIETDYNYYVKATFQKDPEQLITTSNIVSFKLYEVSSADDLNNIRSDLNGYYIQTTNINLAVSPYNEGTGWVPIGNSSTKFSGTFDGNNHTISNLFINSADSYGVGLFGINSYLATLKNVSLENIDITNGVNWAWAIGGLVGENNGSIINSYTTGNLHETDESGEGIGGLVGDNYFLIDRSYSNVNVIGGDWAIGGLVGENRGIILNSYSTGSVSGVLDSVGGLVGANYDGIIENSYSTGLVTGLTNVGGLVGDHDDDYITSSYYNSQTSGQSDDDGRGTPRTTLEMTYPYDDSENDTYVDWDFVDTWHSDINLNVNNGYPVNYTYIDSVGPVITILGSNPLSIYKGDSYYDEGATAIDAVDGDITNDICRYKYSRIIYCHICSIRFCY